jgi:hypothetical protein
MAVPWGFKFIENELQTQVHPSAAGPNPMAQKRKNNFKNKKPQGTAGTDNVWDVKFIEKELQKQVHPSTAGPNPVAQKCKKNSSNTHPRHCWYRQCPGASDSFTRTCKHKSINQLQGLF